MLDHRKVVAIDVDDTVVDIYPIWTEWALQRGITIDNRYHVVGSNALYFWLNPNLYDNLNPVVDSVEVINELYKEYYIIFISSCEEEHRKSKINFLNRHFNFHGFADIKNKQEFMHDILIDDSVHQCTENDILFKNIRWVDIPKLIKEKLC